MINSRLFIVIKRKEDNMVIIIQEFGAIVGKKSNCLLIKSSKGEKEVCADMVNELHIYPSCSISSDAIELCMKKDIWILFLNSYGNPQGEILPFSGGCSPLYKRKQLLLAQCREGVDIVKAFLVQKLENRVRQFKQILRNKRKQDTILFLSTRIRRIQEEAEKIQAFQGERMDEARDYLQGYEGAAGRAYFECISYLLPENMKFSQRMRNADDIYNCVLNYLYGILYAKVKKAAYQCRLDPYIGIMHVDSYNKPTFVYDFIEGQRIICEELAFELCTKKKIGWKDVSKEENGLRFSDDARKLIVSLFYNKLKENCYYKKKQVTIERRLYLEMLETAQRIGEIEDVLAAV